MKLMHLPDGPGWSPDGGYFWVKGDTLYWEDGATWDMNDGCVIRVGFGPYECENFSAWTDEQRAAALAAAAERREQIRKEIDNMPLRVTLKSGETVDYPACHDGDALITYDAETNYGALVITRTRISRDIGIIPSWSSATAAIYAPGEWVKAE